MTGPSDRRGFLRGLATLPLIGGGVTLIGNPVAAAEPVTPDLLAAYDDFLFYERRLLLVGMYPDPAIRRIAEDCYPQRNPRGEFHFPRDRSWDQCPLPAERAAVVLSAVGCEWKRAKSRR